MQYQTDSASFRIVTIGQGSVGKSSILYRLVDNKFNPYETPTIAANFQSYTRTIHGTKIEMQIWDTAGQERYRALNQAYYRNAAAAIAVFSMTNRESLASLETEIETYHSIAGPSALVYVAANKYDLQDEFEIPIEDAQNWAERNHYKFFFTSAKNGSNVHKLFNSLAEELYKLYQSKSVVLAQKNQLTTLSDNVNISSCC